MVTSTSIRLSSEKIPTTKNKILWAIQKEFAHVFKVFEDHLLIGVYDHEGLASIFGRIEQNTSSLELFGYSGRIDMDVEEMNFLRKKANNCYPTWCQSHEVCFDRYSLLDCEK